MASKIKKKTDDKAKIASGKRPSMPESELRLALDSELREKLCLLLLLMILTPERESGYIWHTTETQRREKEIELNSFAGSYKNPEASGF